jgi:hypothetical protein
MGYARDSSNGGVHARRISATRHHTYSFQRNTLFNL